MQKTITWNRPWVAVVLSLTLCATLWHLSQWHASQLTRATDCALWHGINCGLLSKKGEKKRQMSRSKYRFRRKDLKFIHFCKSSFVFLFLVQFVSRERGATDALPLTRQAPPHPVCTLAMSWREESAVYRQTELKGLMDQTAYFNNWKHCGPEGGFVSMWFSFLPPCRVPAPSFNLLETRRQADRQTGERSRSISQPHCFHGNHV